MAITFERHPHPQVEDRKKAGPPKSDDAHVGFNGRIALMLTSSVGTMWCAYIFAILAIVALPSALQGGTLAIIQWISQTFIQLVMLSVIMVGQNIIGATADKRAEMTYKDADATFHEAGEIQNHLKIQDEALNTMMDKLIQLEASMKRG